MPRDECYPDPSIRSIAAVTPTICSLMGVELPALSESEPLATVIAAAQGNGVQRAERILVFAPDAIGAWYWRENRGNLERVSGQAPVQVALHAELPTVTPVCFASMFTGAPPEGHGIRRYERPVLSCDTLFDALRRAGKRVALVAVANSSIDLIFRRRDLDYFSEPYDAQVAERALALLERDEHDLVVAYQQEYDDTMHRTTPRSPEALEAIDRHMETLERLAQAAADAWRAHDWALAVTPDHGTHLDPVTGKGAHGADLAEDTEVEHFWRLERRRT